MRDADWLTVLQAAFEGKVHPSTVDLAIRKQELPVRWSFGRRLIKRADLEAWSRARETRRPPSGAKHHEAASGGAA